MKILLVLGALTACNAVQAQNYCDKNLCPAGKTHIACGNKGAFAGTCPANAKMVDMQPHIPTILEIHNSNRNRIAGGDVPRFESAVRMATMQWDSELAKLAALNVKQCVMKHDECRNTPTFKHSGQNLASMSYNGPENSKSDDFLVKNRVTAWWDEYKNANMNQIRKYPADYSGPPIGHFTVFVAEVNDRVGCAASRYTRGGTHNFLIGCNYATTNIKDKSIYTSGSTASKCTTATDTTYKNLCSKREEYTQ